MCKAIEDDFTHNSSDGQNNFLVGCGSLQIHRLESLTEQLIVLYKQFMEEIQKKI